MDGPVIDVLVGAAYVNLSLDAASAGLTALGHSVNYHPGWRYRERAP